jgi:hypothetical protein
MSHRLLALQYIYCETTYQITHQMPKSKELMTLRLCTAGWLDHHSLTMILRGSLYFVSSDASHHISLFLPCEHLSEVLPHDRRRL